MSYRAFSRTALLLTAPATRGFVGRSLFYMLGGAVLTAVVGVLLGAGVGACVAALLNPLLAGAGMVVPAVGRQSVLLGLGLGARTGLSVGLVPGLVLFPLGAIVALKRHATRSEAECMFQELWHWVPLGMAFGAVIGSLALGGLGGFWNALTGDSSLLEEALILPTVGAPLLMTLGGLCAGWLTITAGGSRRLG